MKCLPQTSSSLALSISLLLCVTISEVGCLKLVRLGVPQYKLRGELAILECHFELQGDSLYSVKWYKENEEFYRFLPKSKPPQNAYKVEGIKVDITMSDSKQVALRSVNLKTSGLYRCEVSAEGPSFASAQGEARMEVLYLPQSGPQIKGEQKHYHIGDEINLNCSSGKSYPASILHWYINDQLVVDPRILRQHESSIFPHGLVSSILGLSMTVLPHHFIDGSMKLRCVASISPVVWQGDKESVVQRMAPLIDNREALLLVKGGSSVISSSVVVLLISLLITLHLQLRPLIRLS